MANNDFSKIFGEMFGKTFDSKNYNDDTNEPDEYIASNADELTQMMYTLVKDKTELTLRPMKNTSRVALCNAKNEVLHTFEDAMMGKRFYIMTVIGEY